MRVSQALVYHPFFHPKLRNFLSCVHLIHGPVISCLSEFPLFFLDRSDGCEMCFVLKGLLIEI